MVYESPHATHYSHGPYARAMHVALWGTAFFISNMPWRSVSARHRSWFEWFGVFWIAFLIRMRFLSKKIVFWKPKAFYSAVPSSYGYWDFGFYVRILHLLGTFSDSFDSLPIYNSSKWRKLHFSDVSCSFGGSAFQWIWESSVLSSYLIRYKRKLHPGASKSSQKKALGFTKPAF